MERTYLHLDYDQNDQFRFQMHGDPMKVVNMITTIMKKDTNIMACIAAGVAQFCDDQNILRKEFLDSIQFFK